MHMRNCLIIVYNTSTFGNRYLKFMGCDKQKSCLKKQVKDFYGDDLFENVLGICSQIFYFCWF